MMDSEELTALLVMLELCKSAPAGGIAFAFW